MPASRSGLRRDSVWKTKASISMPVPEITQAISVPSTPVTRPNDAGSAKMPEPTIDPTTSATSALRESLWSTSFDEGAMTRRLSGGDEVGKGRTGAVWTNTLVSTLEALLPSAHPGFCVDHKQESDLPAHRRTGPDVTLGVRRSLIPAWRRPTRSLHGRIRQPSRVLPRCTWHAGGRLPGPRAHVPLRPDRGRICRQYERRSAWRRSRLAQRPLPVTNV